MQEKKAYSPIYFFLLYEVYNTINEKSKLLLAVFRIVLPKVISACIFWYAYLPHRLASIDSSRLIFYKVWH